MFHVIVCIPKSLLGVIEPCFPRSKWTPAYLWEEVNVVYTASVKGFPFICYILFISTHKFSHFYFSDSPPTWGLSWLVLIQGLQNTLTHYATFYYMVSGNFTVVANIFMSFWNMTWSYAFKWICLFWQMEPILHNSVSEIEQEKQQELVNSPKQWIIKDYHAPWWSLQEHQCGLQLLINCWDHFPISVWVSGSLLAWLLSC